MIANFLRGQKKNDVHKRARIHTHTKTRVTTDCATRNTKEYIIHECDIFKFGYLPIVGEVFFPSVG